MIRRIIQIDEEKCNGCGLCANACHEGAIGIANGKARLLRDDYCDGLGDCLPVCPTGAICFVEREAAAYDEAAVLANQKKKQAHGSSRIPLCPGSLSRQIRRPEAGGSSQTGSPVVSQLRQWPIQIKLAPVHAPWLHHAHLLIAADCTAYAYGNFHQDFIQNRMALIGCPKLDSGDYSEKLTDILRQNEILSLTVVRMEVPCCGGIERAALSALEASGASIPFRVVTLTADGRILDQKESFDPF